MSSAFLSLSYKFQSEVLYIEQYKKNAQLIKVERSIS